MRRENSVMARICEQPAVAGTRKSERQAGTASKRVQQNVTQNMYVTSGTKRHVQKTQITHASASDPADVCPNAREPQAVSMAQQAKTACRCRAIRKDEARPRRAAQNNSTSSKKRRQRLLLSRYICAAAKAQRCRKGRFSTHSRRCRCYADRRAWHPAAQTAAATAEALCHVRAKKPKMRRTTRQQRQRRTR